MDVLLGSAQKDLPKAELAAITEELGLNESPVKQYLLWLKGWTITKPEQMTGLGLSYRDGRPVQEVIGERVIPTVVMVGMALLLSFGAGISLGAILAYLSFRGPIAKKVAGLLVAFATFVYALPNFWLAFLLVALLALRPYLYTLPIFGLHAPGASGSAIEMLPFLLLPAILLSLRRLAKIALYVQNMALEELGKEYVLVALAKGLSRAQVIKRHVIKNCLLPVVNLLGLALPAMVGGSVLIESIFCVPGLGRLAVESAFARNYPVLMGLTMLYGVVVTLSSMLADILSSMLDKRLELS
ncbi:MAG: ABC transporter permease [Candidatus Obscuribacter sp.]|nr:ABC transporter permease [Candidatus Obscuribacter sp.]MBP6595293.1 ABC transporter permease [Candidatus Obscuribacter sp.]